MEKVQQNTTIRQNSQFADKKSKNISTYQAKTNVVNAQRQINPTFVLAFAFSASKTTQLPTTTTTRSLFPINPMELLSTSR
ncbi:hypothetical protein T12_2386 [Trichinella patagoniensis]|nr:hypothetical protein T12_2386 [Trichinella patagoniensis]